MTSNDENEFSLLVRIVAPILQTVFLCFLTAGEAGMIWLFWKGLDKWFLGKLISFDPVKVYVVLLIAVAAVMLAVGMQSRQARRS